jgi:hypothetical protein
VKYIICTPGVEDCLFSARRCAGVLVELSRNRSTKITVFYLAAPEMFWKLLASHESVARLLEQ